MINVLNEIDFHSKVSRGNTFAANKFAFILIYSGYINFEVNGIYNHYEKGNVIIITTNSLYKVLDYCDDIQLYILTGDREELRDNLNLNFNRYDLYRLSHNIRGKYNLIFDGNDLKVLTNTFEHLYLCVNTDTSKVFNDEIKILLLSLIIYSIFGKLVEEFGSKNSNNNRKEEIVLEFLRILEDNYKSQRDLKFYADKQFLSIKYLSNCIREITGIPPSDFIQARVLNHAKFSLLNKNIPINSIAADLGFSDQYAFGKFFKKHTGLSPKHYRQENSSLKKI